MRRLRSDTNILKFIYQFATIFLSHYFDMLMKMAFRKSLREEIEFKGMLVKEVAAAAGISSSTFLSYIDARGVLPNVETAVKIAQTLGVSVEYLVMGKNENRTFRLNEIQTIVDDLLALDKEKIAVLQKMIHALV